MRVIYGLVVTSDFVFHYLRRPVSWASRRQACPSLSTTEPEFLAAAEATKEALQLQELLSNFGINH